MGHWLNSIAFQAPRAPFVLVGTHKDELESAHTQLTEAQRLVHAYIKDMHIAGEDGIIKNIRKPPKEGTTSPWFFAVDSKSRKVFDGKVSDPAIIQLRDALQEAVALDDRQVKGLSV